MPDFLLHLGGALLSFEAFQQASTLVCTALAALALFVGAAVARYRPHALDGLDLVYVTIISLFAGWNAANWLWPPPPDHAWALPTLLATAAAVVTAFPRLIRRAR